MPELPEVEITRRHLADAMVDRAVTGVRISHPRTIRHNASGAEVKSLLLDRRVEEVGRHGKFLLVRLDDGHTMVAHLGMSGRFSIQTRDGEQAPHTHFVATLDDGSEIRFIDPRTFGFIAVYDEDELVDSGVGRLGPDAWLSPLDPAGLTSALAGRTAPIKALLLDQGLVAGLGNIYADEALHKAGIHPLRRGGDVGEEDAGRLIRAIREVLARAIESGGTTLDDLAYLLPDGQAGENLAHIGVYGREGEACARCGEPIERIVVRSRSTHFCPKCQT